MAPILKLKFQEKNKNYMSYNNLLISQSNGVCTITINRPNKLNALNKETIQELHNAIQEANLDKLLKVIILTGSG